MYANKWILAVNVLMTAGVVFAQDSAPAVAQLPVAELQQFLDDYEVTLTAEETEAVRRFAMPIEDKRGWELIDRVLSAKDEHVPLQAVTDLSRFDSSGFLRNHFSRSKDPMVRFSMNVFLATSGDLEGAEGLLRLINDRSLDVKVQRAIKTFVALLQIPNDNVDAPKIIAVLSPPPKSNLIGKAAPEFKAKTISGMDVSLSDFRGKVVLIHFWATWCGPCMAEMPDLKAELAKYPSDRFVTVFVSMDIDDADSHKQIGELQIPSHSIFDAATAEEPLHKTYMIRSFPSDVIVDTVGIVRSFSRRDIPTVLQ